MEEHGPDLIALAAREGLLDEQNARAKLQGRPPTPDLLARGEHEDKSKPEAGEVPPGPATLAVAVSLAEPDESSRVVPLYTWDLPDYLRTSNLRVTELRK